VLLQKPRHCRKAFYHVAGWRHIINASRPASPRQRTCAGDAFLTSGSEARTRPLTSDGADLGAICEHSGDGATQDAEQQEQRQLVQRPQLVLGHSEGRRRAEAGLRDEVPMSAQFPCSVCNSVELFVAALSVMRLFHRTIYRETCTPGKLPATLQEKEWLVIHTISCANLGDDGGEDAGEQDHGDGQAGGVGGVLAGQALGLPPQHRLDREEDAGDGRIEARCHTCAVINVAGQSSWLLVVPKAALSRV